MIYVFVLGEGLGMVIPWLNCLGPTIAHLSQVCSGDGCSFWQVRLINVSDRRPACTESSEHRPAVNRLRLEHVTANGVGGGVV